MDKVPPGRRPGPPPSSKKIAKKTAAAAAAAAASVQAAKSATAAAHLPTARAVGVGCAPVGAPAHRAGATYCQFCGEPGHTGARCPQAPPPRPEMRLQVAPAPYSRAAAWQRAHRDGVLLQLEQACADPVCWAALAEPKVKPSCETHKYLKKHRRHIKSGCRLL
jgi:hypothetical protein